MYGAAASAVAETPAPRAGPCFRCKRKNSADNGKPGANSPRNHESGRINLAAGKRAAEGFGYWGMTSCGIVGAALVDDGFAAISSIAATTSPTSAALGCAMSAPCEIVASAESTAATNSADGGLMTGDGSGVGPIKTNPPTRTIGSIISLGTSTRPSLTRKRSLLELTSSVPFGALRRKVFSLIRAAPRLASSFVIRASTSASDARARSIRDMAISPGSECMPPDALNTVSTAALFDGRSTKLISSSLIFVITFLFLGSRAIVLPPILNPFSTPALNLQIVPLSTTVGENRRPVLVIDFG